MDKSILLAVLLVCFSYILTGYYYYELPNRIIEVGMNEISSGDISFISGMFFIPFIMSLMIVLFFSIPYIDPLKKNIAKFRTYYNNFAMSIFLFIFIVQFLSFLNELGIKIEVIRFVPLGIGGILFFTGMMLEKSERNWFIGIRTPWTLSSDRVWIETHRVGGILFKANAVISLFGVFWPLYFWMFLLPLIGASIFLIVYSYIIYNK